MLAWEAAAQAQRRAAAAVVPPAADPAVPAGMAAPVADCYPHQMPPKPHSCQAAAAAAAAVAAGGG